MPDQEELHHVDRSFMVLVAHVNEMLMAARDIEVNKYGLTATQARVLTQIVYNEGKELSISDIARVLHRQPSGVATLVNRMINKGLLEDDHSAEQKGNARIIKITEKGRDIYNKTKDLEIITDILGILPLEKRREICKALVQVYHKAYETINIDKIISFNDI